MTPLDWAAVIAIVAAIVATAIIVIQEVKKDMREIQRIADDTLQNIYKGVRQRV
jgi:hypothetical protein